MSDFSAADDSPCVRNCCLDTDDVCLGCFRSLDEIRRWTLVDGDTRRQFLANAERRKKQYPHQGLIDPALRRLR